MALGGKAKASVFEVCSKIFPDTFMYNSGKELRINLIEDGNPVQLKMTLTAAKVPVSADGEAETFDKAPAIDTIEPTEEEIAKVNEYLKMLGLI